MLVVVVVVRLRQPHEAFGRPDEGIEALAVADRDGLVARAVQDRLGELNDVAVARAVAMKAVGRRSGEVAFAAGLEVGRLTRDEAAVLDAANDALRAFRKVRPFWESQPGRNDDLKVSGTGLRTARRA